MASGAAQKVVNTVADVADAPSKTSEHYGDKLQDKFDPQKPGNIYDNAVQKYGKMSEKKLMPDQPMILKNKNKSQLSGWLFLLRSVKLNGIGIFDRTYIRVLFSGYIALQKGGRCL